MTKLGQTLSNINNIVYLIFLFGVAFHLVRDMFQKKKIRRWTHEALEDILRERTRKKK